MMGLLLTNKVRLMPVRVIFFFLLCTVLEPSVPAYAQEANELMAEKFFEQRRQHKMNDLYEALVSSIYTRDDKAEQNLYVIRSYYPHTSQYDPFPEKLEKEIMRLSYNVKNAAAPEEERDALIAYKAFVASHLANIDVLYWAIVLAEQDVRFGNASFYRWVRGKLIDLIFEIPVSTSPEIRVPRRDGRSLDKALSIVTFGEENVVLGRIGGEILKTDLRTQEVSAYHYINIHDIKDPKTGKVFQIYVNVTIPLEHSLDAYERKKLEEKRSVRRRGG